MGKRIGSRGPLSADRALASRIFWGVIERRLTLDYLIGCYSRTPVKKLQPAVREILRSGLYQLLYMDRIPVPAAVNESVNLTRSMGVGHASRFVNAVMRAAAREGLGRIEGLPEGEEKGAVVLLSPGADRFWQSAYGRERALALTACLNDEPDACFRVDLLRVSPAEWEEELSRLEIVHQWDKDLPGCLYIPRPQELKRLEAPFREAYYAQDKASQWCCAALGALPGRRWRMYARRREERA